MWLDRRRVVTILVLVVGVAAATWLMWGASPSDRPARDVSATVLSITPGVQAKSDPEPIQAVIVLRVEDGTLISVKRPVACIPAIRPGDRVAVRGTPTNFGGARWRLVADRCLR